MPIKLYGHPLTTCTRRVLVILEEKQVPYELIVIDIPNGKEHKTPEYLTKQPFGVVPYIVSFCLSLKTIHLLELTAYIHSHHISLNGLIGRRRLHHLRKSRHLLLHCGEVCRPRDPGTRTLTHQSQAKCAFAAGDVGGIIVFYGVCWEGRSREPVQAVRLSLITHLFPQNFSLV